MAIWIMKHAIKAGYPDSNRERVERQVESGEDAQFFCEEKHPLNKGIITDAYFPPLTPLKMSIKFMNFKKDLKSFFHFSGVFDEHADLRHTPFIVFFEENNLPYAQIFHSVKDLLAKIEDDNAQVLGQWLSEWHSDFYVFTVGDIRRHFEDIEKAEAKEKKLEEKRGKAKKAVMKKRAKKIRKVL